MTIGSTAALPVGTNAHEGTGISPEAALKKGGRIHKMKSQESKAGKLALVIALFALGPFTFFLT